MRLMQAQAQEVPKEACLSTWRGLFLKILYLIKIMKRIIKPTNF
jgi:hypothetical protein